jgi:hypothetical protein
MKEAAAAPPGELSNVSRRCGAPWRNARMAGVHISTSPR